MCPKIRPQSFSCPGRQYRGPPAPRSKTAATCYPTHIAAIDLTAAPFLMEPPFLSNFLYSDQNLWTHLRSRRTAHAEPLRSIRCAPPLTSLHRLLPAITWGYAIFDLVDSFYLGDMVFAVHSVALAAVMGLVCEIGISHHITPMLLMEVRRASAPN